MTKTDQEKYQSNSSFLYPLPSHNQKLYLDKHHDKVAVKHSVTETHTQHEKYFYVTNNIREKYLYIDGGVTYIKCVVVCCNDNFLHQSTFIVD